MRLSILISLIFSLLVFGTLAFAAEDFTVYKAKFRPTEELVRVGESIFGGKATFATMADKVVINADTKTTARVLKLFADLDKMPKRFRISFRLVSKSESVKNSIGFQNGKVSVGKKVNVDGTLAANSGDATEKATSVQPRIS